MIHQTAELSSLERSLVFWPMECGLPRAMQVVLGLLFCSVLFSTGASLKCETCFGYGKHCTGTWQKCDVGQDTCIVLLNEFTVGVLTIPVLTKACSYREGCKSGPFRLTFGQETSMTSNAVCCEGEACRSAFPQAQSVNEKPNGLQCPGCYSVTDTCPEEMAPCTGSEDTCFDIIVHTHRGIAAVATTLKGCTTEPVCTRFKTGTVNFAGLHSVFTRAECRQAESVGIYGNVRYKDQSYQDTKARATETRSTHCREEASFLDGRRDILGK